MNAQAVYAFLTFIAGVLSIIAIELSFIAGYVKRGRKS